MGLKIILHIYIDFLDTPLCNYLSFILIASLRDYFVLVLSVKTLFYSLHLYLFLGDLIVSCSRDSPLSAIFA
jgi:hypothetical protein